MVASGSPNSAMLDKLISSMEKAFRSYRLYEARGPQYEAHVREMASQAALATEQGPAILTVTPHGLQTTMERAPEENDLNRTWFELFEQGARQIVFTTGIENREVREMLQIMANDQSGGEDILTVLWRRELKHIQIVVARTLVRGMGANLSTQETLEAQYGHWRNLLAPEAGTSDKQIQLSPDDLRVLAVESDPLLWCVDCLEPPQTDSGLEIFTDKRDELETFLGLLGEMSSDECDHVLTHLIGSYARLGLVEKINQLMTAAEAHPALGDWSLQRMLAAAGGIDALIPLIEAGPNAFRESLFAMAAGDAAMMEELLQKIETDTVRDEIQALVITKETAPLAFHSGRLSSPELEEQLDSVKVLFDMGTEEATYLAIEGCASFHTEVRVYTLGRMEKIYEPPMRNSMTRLFRDKDESVRIQVVRFIKDSGERHFLREALALAKDGYFGRRSEEEQWEVIQALSTHGKLPPINLFFCGVALSGSLWTSEHMLRIQHEAIRVLGRFPSVDGLHTLKKLSRRLVGAKELRDAARAELQKLDHASKSRLKGSEGAES
jgi:hypothetical protein